MIVDFEQKDSCPIKYTLSVLGGKWKLLILYYLNRNDIMRYGELKKSIAGITHKMLSSQLKELESYGVIHRKEYPHIPPKVEYSFSEKGKTLLPLLGFMYNWGAEHMDTQYVPCIQNKS